MFGDGGIEPPGIVERVEVELGALQRVVDIGFHQRAQDARFGLQPVGLHLGHERGNGFLVEEVLVDGPVRSNHSPRCRRERGFRGGVSRRRAKPVQRQSGEVGSDRNGIAGAAQIAHEQGKFHVVDAHPIQHDVVADGLPTGQVQKLLAISGPVAIVNAFGEVFVAQFAERARILRILGVSAQRGATAEHTQANDAGERPRRGAGARNSTIEHW
jgi:hypothetical protein